MWQDMCYLDFFLLILEVLYILRILILCLLLCEEYLSTLFMMSSVVQFPVLTKSNASTFLPL